MLQWMGGSRRKVTTMGTLQSRKSTHKRQRQYFEQRKRQQQQTDGLESYADGNHSFDQHPENNRSLDILSLLSVSTVAQKHNPSCLSERDDSENDDDFTFNRQRTHSPPAIQINELTPVDQFERNEEGTSSSYRTENEYSKKFPVRLPDYNENMDGHSKKLDCFNTFPAHQLSVIDLLGDGGANDDAEKHSVHAMESHMAFSVEGLGKVQTETPVHSPEMPERSFLNGFGSPRKARRKPIKSKYLDNGFDNLASLEAIDPYDNSFEQAFCPSDIVNLHDNPNHKFSTFRKPLPFNSQISNLEGAFDDDDVHFFDIRDRGRTKWNGPSFLEDTDDLNECELLWNNSADLRDVSFNDFENWNLQNKRSSRTNTKRTTIFDLTVPPSPYSKHQISGELPDFKVSDTSWYSNISIENDVKDNVNRVVDDSRESLSLLSEGRRNKDIVIKCHRVIDNRIWGSEDYLTRDNEDWKYWTHSCSGLLG